MIKSNFKAVKVAILQLKVLSNLQENLEHIRQLVQKAKAEKAEIVCLPELFATQYFAQSENKNHFHLAEPIPGPLSNYLSKLAQENQVFLVGGSIFEQGENNKYYNTNLIFDRQGKMISKYRKVHIPQDQYYYEQFYFQSGNLGYVQAKTDKAVIAPLICYDQWFPEAARVNALAGAEILFYPTAIGWFDEMQKAEPFSAQRWEDAMKSHASLNGIYVAACNRVGKEGQLDFWGGSFIADPYGQVLARCSGTEEEMLVLELDLNKVKSSQESWGFLESRHPETYKSITQNNERNNNKLDNK